MLLYFNSIKVRLEQFMETQLTFEEEYFNSIKVRLEQGINNAAQTFIAFQFHKGTIRTDAFLIGGGLSALFQFHKGTIRTMNLITDVSACLISIP